MRIQISSACSSQIAVEASWLHTLVMACVDMAEPCPESVASVVCLQALLSKLFAANMKAAHSATGARMLMQSATSRRPASGLITWRGVSGSLLAYCPGRIRMPCLGSRGVAAKRCLPPRPEYRSKGLRLGIVHQTGRLPVVPPGARTESILQSTLQDCAPVSS